MPRVRLLHWKAEEAAAHITALRKARHRVDYDEQWRPALLKEWRASPPDAFVVDLSRLPSQGREIAVALRQSPRTRHVPIVFCGGLPEKVSAVRIFLPDAAYCTLATLAATLQKALEQPLANPMQPAAMMDRYKGRTVAQKLGIKPGSILALLDPPPRALHLLGELPADIEVVEEWTPQVSVLLCFLHQPHPVAAALSQVRLCAAHSKLWILWRKGGSAARGDVTEAQVRREALELGLVDYKICSVDSVWTAMLFSLRR